MLMTKSSYVNQVVFRCETLPEAGMSIGSNLSPLFWHFLPCNINMKYLNNCIPEWKYESVPSFTVQYKLLRFNNFCNAYNALILMRLHIFQKMFVIRLVDQIGFSHFRLHCNNSFGQYFFFSLRYIVIIWHMFLTFNDLISVKVIIRSRKYF